VCGEEVIPKFVDLMRNEISELIRYTKKNHFKVIKIEVMNTIGNMIRNSSRMEDLKTFFLDQFDYFDMLFVARENVKCARII
jgi:hypothetical protein